MYSLSICGDGGRYITAAQLQRAMSDIVAETIDLDPELYRDASASCSAIERICSRGISYSNEDFDVLSRAYDLVGRFHQRHGQRRIDPVNVNLA